MKTLPYEYHLEKNIPYRMIELESSDYFLEYYSLDETEPGVDTGNYISYPPLFLQENGRYTILLGRKYIDSLLEEKENVPFGLIIERKGDDYLFFFHLLRVKKELQGFNVIEKSMAVKKMHDMRGEADSSLLELLGIPIRKEYVDRYLRLYESCDEMKSMLAQGKLHENTAFEIIKCHKSMWKDLAVFLKAISLGTKKKTLICKMLHEIAGDDVTRLRKIIHSPELNEIHASSIDPLHKGERILSFIEDSRYPVMSSYRKRFNEKLKAVGIQKDFHMTLPKDFETWDFTVTLQFSSVEELMQKAERLKKYADTKAFADLMRMRG
jgi:hypothetical protein